MHRKCSGSERFTNVVRLNHFSLKYLCLLFSLVCHVHCLGPEIASMFNKHNPTIVRSATEVIGIIFGKVVPCVCRKE